jgi:hypothetical protein
MGISLRSLAHAAVLTAGVVVGGFALAAGPAFGTIAITVDPSYQSEDGGEFAVTTFTANGATLPPLGTGVGVTGALFQTFCLEIPENIETGKTYDWISNDGAVLGGYGGATNGEDPVSPKTAFLYRRFWDGNLPDYNYTLGSGRAASARSLQLAIWYLEDEINSTDSPGHLAEYNGDAQAQAWVTYATNNAGSGTGDVYALNLSQDGGQTLIQDVLVRLTFPREEQNPGTPGFWSNKNGQKLIDEGDLQALRDLCLVDENGDDFDPDCKRDVKNWLLDGNATNMAYMLSVHLTAMTLNVRNGKVDADALIYAPDCDGGQGFGGDYISIADLLDAAADALCEDGYTPSGDANRHWQECLKNALDDANNNLNFVN